MKKKLLALAAVENTVQWDAETTKAQFNQSCADCHSHETKWPLYAILGPASFLAAHDVNEGREHFNISTKEMGDADDAAEVVLSEEMPPKSYLLMHPDTRMTEEQRKAFATGLKRPLAARSISIKKLVTA